MSGESRVLQHELPIDVAHDNTVRVTLAQLNAAKDRMVEQQSTSTAMVIGLIHDSAVWDGRESVLMTAEMARRWGITP